MIELPQVSSTECVAFCKGIFDSHAAYDNDKKIYTFAVDGTYVMQKNGRMYLLKKKSGDTMKMPGNYIVSDRCGMFFNMAFHKYKKQEEAKEKK